MLARSPRRVASVAYAAALTAALPASAMLVAACNDAKAPTAPAVATPSAASAVAA